MLGFVGSARLLLPQTVLVLMYWWRRYDFVIVPNGSFRLVLCERQEQVPDRYSVQQSVQMSLQMLVSSKCSNGPCESVSCLIQKCSSALFSSNSENSPSS